VTPAHQISIAFVTAAILAMPLFASASGYQSLRFEEDWREDCSKISPKCWRIGETSSLTFGADARIRTQGYWPLDFGIGSQTSGNDYTLFRGMAHGDLRIRNHVQLFVQFGVYDEIGRRGGPISVDRSNPDLQQGFLAWNGKALSLRLGRQEITLGTSRLLSVREGPNIRLAFDGARTSWHQESYRVDAFVFRPILNRSGAFDDTANKSQSLSGVYATFTPEIMSPLKIDLYWLRYERDQGQFAITQGRERRDSFGTRLFGSTRGWDWNLETVFQTGHFSNQIIRAWTVASDTGFTFSTLPWSPRLGLRTDIASGDKNLDDGRLGTFNALYPNPTYLSEAALLAPGNLMDLHPILTINPGPQLKIMLGWNFLWKHHKEDAVYTPPAPLVAIPETIGTGRYIGDQIGLESSYRFSPQWEARMAAVHFRAGSALTQAGGKNVDFLMASLAFRW
jgi:hypothetical protein